MDEFKAVIWASIFGAFFYLSSQSARAETIPIPGASYVVDYGFTASSSPSGACTARGATYGTQTCGGQSVTGTDRVEGDQCIHDWGCTSVSSTITVTGGSCPSGYTVQGIYCFKADPPPVDCPAAGTVANISGSGTVNGGACLAGTCASVNGCAVGECSGGGSGGEGSTASWYMKGCKYTGGAATGEVPEAQSYTPPTNGGSGPGGTLAPADCLAKSQGYITGSSGSVSCVPAADAPNSKIIEKTVTTNTPAGGSPTVETQITETTCTGGDCTVTRTDGDGNETTADKAAFCEANPNAATCKTSEFCEKYPDAAACAKLGEVADTEQLGERSVGMASLPSVTFASNTQCPADVQLPKGAVFKWAPICDAMGWLRPVVLAMAYLAAGLMVAGALRTE